MNQNSTGEQGTETQSIISFDTDGYTVGSGGGVNQSSQTYVSWNWLAGGSQGSSNTDGTINTTYTSANTTSGFSIIQYNGNGTAGATIGHGLGVAPKFVIIKRLDTASNWIVGTGARGFDKFFYLNTTDAETDNAGTFNDTAPSSSLITLGSWNDVNNSSGTYIAYCFAEKTGFSNFGSYTGNGNANGPFVYTGFKPALFLLKESNGTNSWQIFDNKRPGYNLTDKYLKPNESAAEVSGNNQIDILSNGVKLRSSNTGNNGSGQNFIYMAFAEAPLVSSNGVPVTAR